MLCPVEAAPESGPFRGVELFEKMLTFLGFWVDFERVFWKSEIVINGRESTGFWGCAL